MIIYVQYIYSCYLYIEHPQHALTISFKQSSAKIDARSETRSLFVARTELWGPSLEEFDDWSSWCGGRSHICSFAGFGRFIHLYYYILYIITHLTIVSYIIQSQSWVSQGWLKDRLLEIHLRSDVFCGFVCLLSDLKWCLHVCMGCWNLLTFLFGPS